MGHQHGIGERGHQGVDHPGVAARAAAGRAGDPRYPGIDVRDDGCGQPDRDVAVVGLGHEGLYPAQSA